MNRTEQPLNPKTKAVAVPGQPVKTVKAKPKEIGGESQKSVREEHGVRQVPRGPLNDEGKPGTCTWNPGVDPWSNPSPSMYNRVQLAKTL